MASPTVTDAAAKLLATHSALLALPRSQARSKHAAKPQITEATVALDISGRTSLPKRRDSMSARVTDGRRRTLLLMSTTRSTCSDQIASCSEAMAGGHSAGRLGQGMARYQRRACKPEAVRSQSGQSEKRQDLITARFNRKLGRARLAYIDHKLWEILTLKICARCRLRQQNPPAAPNPILLFFWICLINVSFYASARAT